MPMDRERPRLGLTLVELVVAIALSAMLMTAMVGVLKGVHQQGRLVDQMRRSMWQDRLTELLYQDLLAAETLHVSDGFIQLTGEFRSLDIDDPVFAHQVMYGIVDRSRDGQVEQGRHPYSVLVRQTERGRGLIAIDPGQLRVERFDREGHLQPLPPLPGPMPGRVRVSILSHKTGKHSFRRELVLQ